MPEKSRQQWVRAMRRWLVVGAVAGAGFGTYAAVTWDDGHGVVGSLAFSVPMGAAMAVMLWGSAYRYDFVRVWGGVAAGWTALVLILLIATGVGVGCVQGICGER